MGVEFAGTQAALMPASLPADSDDMTLCHCRLLMLEGGDGVPLRRLSG